MAPPRVGSFASAGSAAGFLFTLFSLISVMQLNAAMVGGRDRTPRHHESQSYEVKEKNSLLSWHSPEMQAIFKDDWGFEHAQHLMGRARKRSRGMSVEEALQVLAPGKVAKFPVEVKSALVGIIRGPAAAELEEGNGTAISLLQQGLGSHRAHHDHHHDQHHGHLMVNSTDHLKTALMQADVGATTTTATTTAMFSGDTPVDQAMRFLNAELKENHEEMDIRLFECGSYKAQNEPVISALAIEAEELGRHIGSISARIAAAETEIDAKKEAIDQTVDEMAEQKEQCETTQSALNEELKILKEDLAVAKLILKTADSSCTTTSMLLLEQCVDKQTGAPTVFRTDNDEISKHMSLLKSSAAKALMSQMIEETITAEHDGVPVETLRMDQAEAAEGDSDEEGHDVDAGQEEGQGQEESDDDGNKSAAEEQQTGEDGPGEGGDASEETDDHDVATSPLSFLETQKRRDATGHHHRHHRHHHSRHHHHHRRHHHQHHQRDSGSFRRKGVGLLALSSSSGGGGGTGNPVNCVGLKPNCANLKDKMGQMKGDLEDQIQDKEAEIAKHTDDCTASEKEMREDLQAKKTSLETAQVDLQADVAAKATAQQEKASKDAEQHNACEEMRSKYAACHADLKTKEVQACGILKVRKATYQQLTKKDDDIQDCDVGGWSIHACSATCATMNGRPGIQLMTRKVITEKNKYGAACPPLQTERVCAREPCPVDCVMSDWGGWSSCTADCGGGSMVRTRSASVPAAFGGEPCPEDEEAQSCNTFACDQDCVLDDWSPWEPCSKSCQVLLPSSPLGAMSPPGNQYRDRGVRIATRGNGKCSEPLSQERHQRRACNAFACPSKLTCDSPMDMVILMDGSGSLWHRGPYKTWGRNFERQVKFAEKIIAAADLDGHTVREQEKYPPKKMRIGLVTFAWKNEVLSPLTGKRADLEAGLKKAKWPMGGTMTHNALAKAASMMKYTSDGRLKTIVLITDGRPTRRNPTFKMAQLVKRKGIRLMVVPVGHVVSQQDVCKMASAPCLDNADRAKDWSELEQDFQRFLVGACPKVSPAQ